MVISPDSSTWSYWSIDTSVIKVTMAIGNGLSNSGDKLTLKDTGSTIIDSLSYGTNIDVWNPALPDIDEGHSLERNPGGKDSDSISDFIDQESPTPGRTIALAPQSPSPAPASSSSSKSPSPSPTPLPSPSTTPLKSPSPKISPTVLSENIQNTASATPNIQSSSQSSSESQPKIKVAAILIGSGAIVVGLSIGFYLWYSKSFRKSHSDKDDNQDVKIRKGD